MNNSLNPQWGDGNQFDRDDPFGNDSPFGYGETPLSPTQDHYSYEDFPIGETQYSPTQDRFSREDFPIGETPPSPTENLSSDEESSDGTPPSPTDNRWLAAGGLVPSRFFNRSDYQNPRDLRMLDPDNYRNPNSDVYHVRRPPDNVVYPQAQPSYVPSNDPDMYRGHRNQDYHVDPPNIY